MRNAGPALHPAWTDLRDLAFTLAPEATELTGHLAPDTTRAVGDLVRGMSRYDSNSIKADDKRPASGFGWAERP